MVDTVPPWLAVARKYLGVEEIRGPTNNPTILRFVANVAARFPEQAAYASLYKSDDGQAWCGVFAADCFAEVGMRPPYVKADEYLCWMWAQSWKTVPGTKLKVPRVGCIVVFPRHVAFCNKIIDADMIEVIGGNQTSPEGGAVTLSRRSISDADEMIWPAEAGDVQLPPSSFERPELKRGDSNPYVTELQTLLGITVIGVFDDATDAAVRAFQAQHGLDVDGVVGPLTWAALLGQSGSTAKAAPGTLTPALIAQITSLAGASDLARYSWHDRGIAPIGYIKGMAVTFAKVYLDLKNGGSAARVMAQLPSGDSDHDALSWYGVTNITAGVSTLRALFALLIGLGMRESSGHYYEGRDTSAKNVEADTAEAGLFQQSWNSHTASPELPKLIAAYTAKPAEGFLSIFAEGVNGNSDSFGDGDGLRFQLLCKASPAFAVECAAVGLRVLRQHWGPINRREAEIRPEADTLLLKVQAAVDAIAVIKPIDGEVIPPPKPGTGTQPTVSGSIPILGALLLLMEKMKMSNQGHLDINEFIGLLGDPVLQRYLSDQPVRRSELKTLPPKVLHALFGQSVPMLGGPPQPVPVQEEPKAPPTQAEPVPAAPGWTNLKATLAMLLGNVGLVATNVVGTPSLQPGTGSSTVIGTLLPIAITAAGLFGVPAPLVKGAGALLPIIGRLLIGSKKT